MTQFPGRFEFANGMALSPDENLLYVSTFPDGITIVDLIREQPGGVVSFKPYVP